MFQSTNQLRTQFVPSQYGTDIADMADMTYQLWWISGKNHRLKNKARSTDQIASWIPLYHTIYICVYSMYIYIYYIYIYAIYLYIYISISPLISHSIPMLGEIW